MVYLYSSVPLWLIDPALQSHTLLLDLEQLLVVVANLENTKIASNTTSTPTTANADIIRIPLTGTPPPACDGDMAADDHTASTTTTTTETNHLTTNDSVQLLDDAFLAELDAMYSKFSPFKGIGFTELCKSSRATDWWLIEWWFFYGFVLKSFLLFGYWFNLFRFSLTNNYSVNI